MATYRPLKECWECGIKEGEPPYPHFHTCIHDYCVQCWAALKREHAEDDRPWDIEDERP